jgi:hypothetical protein
MKKTILFLFACCLIEAKAQNSFQWADSGAVWHLAYTAFVGPGYQKLVYEKDTLINGQACQKIHREAQIRINVGGGVYTITPVYPEPSYFLYKSNDTIFSYHQNSFHMAFKTNAAVGEIWDLGNYSGFANSVHAYVKVDSVFFQTYNGVSLRNIKIHHCDANGDSLDMNSTTDTIAYSGLLGFMSAGIINEKFGPMQGFNGINHTSINIIADEYTPSALTCYQSTSFPFIQFNTNDCFNNTFVGVDNLKNENFILYPNPANHSIHFNQNTLNYKIIIFDIYGHTVLNELILSHGISVEELPDGIYFYQLMDPNEKLVMKDKLIINK